MFAIAHPWNLFLSATFDNITEWGTTIKARNAIREQGQENPEFGYQVIGDYVDGTPELLCDATPQSPPGRYAIHVLPGTIESEAVDFVDGYLIVTESSEVGDVRLSGHWSTQPPMLYDLQGRPLMNVRRGKLIVTHGKKVVVR